MAFVCAICGKRHEGLGAWAFARPDYWLGLSAEEQRNGKADDDLCRTADGFHFVRCVLEIPVVDGDEATLELGVWGSLSAESFARYVETFDNDDQSRLGPMFSWLSNEIIQFPGSLNLKTMIHPQDNRQRPLVDIEPSDHPLSRAQRYGIRYEDALAIVHAQTAPIAPAADAVQ
jgi:hypothetical protein